MWPSDGQLRAGPDRADHEPGPVGRSSSRRRPRLAISAALLVDLERLVGDLVLVEHEREGAEGGGLDRVDAGLEELGVHLGDEVGPGEHEVLVAALEGERRRSRRGRGRGPASRCRTHRRTRAHARGGHRGRGIRAPLPTGRCAATRVDHRTRLRGYGDPFGSGIHKLPARAAHDRNQYRRRRQGRAPICSPFPCSGPPCSGPAPTPSTVRSAVTSPSSWTRPTSAGKRGETLAVPDAGKLGAKAVVLVGVGDAEKLDADALRRAGAALAPRGRPRSRRSRPRCSTPRPTPLDRADAAQALAEGVHLGSYQFLKYKGDGNAVEADACRRCSAAPTRR